MFYAYLSFFYFFMFHFFYLYFFFFQAEDGIRDATVTGVQTCALPILSGLLTMAALKRRVTRVRGDLLESSHGQEPTQAAARIMGWKSRMPRGKNVRSEERRVGKECG